MSDPRCGQYAGFMAHMAAGTTICEPCKAARLRYNKRLRLDHARGIKRSIPILGSRRRLQGLAALGYTQTELANYLNVSKQRIYQWTTQERYQRIYPATAEAINAVYEQLCMVIPTGSGRKVMREKARAKGYLPPLAWDDIDTDPVDTADYAFCKEKIQQDVDPVVVARILSGDVVPANPAERAEIARLWAKTDRPLTELARLTGWKTERYYRRQDVA